MCEVLDSLSAVVSAVVDLPEPTGLGADVVLSDQVHALTGAVVMLQRQLAVRMAALSAQDPAADTRGDAVRAGLGQAQVTRLHQLGRFSRERHAVRDAWSAGSITIDHVTALRAGTGRLTPDLADELVKQVLPLLPGLSGKHARRLVEYTVDQLDPGDPDLDELADHAARDLSWARTPGGGIAFQGYLPGTEASAFTRAIDALVEDLRVKGDGLTPGQRRADALAALVSRAMAHGLPTGGGLPAAVMMTVSLTEASRVTRRDPAIHGTLFESRTRGGSRIDGKPAGDAAVRFGLCCGSITPILTPEPPDGTALAQIADTPVEPLAVGRGLRLATPAQRKALLLRDGGCAVTGCCVGAAFTQPHHVRPWAMDGKTDLENLVSLCFVHHRQAELGRYRFVPRRLGEPRPDGALENPRWWIVPPIPLAPAPASTRSRPEPAPR